MLIKVILAISTFSSIGEMKTVNVPVPDGNIVTIILLIVKCLILLAALTFALGSLGVFAHKTQ